MLINVVFYLFILYKMITLWHNLWRFMYKNIWSIYGAVTADKRMFLFYFLTVLFVVIYKLVSTDNQQTNYLVDSQK